MNATIISALLILGVAVTDVQAQDPKPALADPAAETKDAWHGTVRLFLGSKALDDHDWEPVDSQGEFAVLTDFGPDDWPVRMAADLRLAVSDEEEVGGLDVSSSSWELNLGVRKIFETQSIVKPYVGGGLAFGGARVDVESNEESDTGVGLWIDAGIDFSLGGPISLGFELAVSSIGIDIGGDDADAGGVTFGVTFGYVW